MSWRGELCFPNRAGPLGGGRTGEYRLRSVFKRVCTGGSMSEGMCSSPGPLHFPIPHPVPHARLMASAASSNPSTCHARDNCGHIRTRSADRARSIAVLVRWHTCGEAMLPAGIDHSPIRAQIVSKHQQERVCVWQRAATGTRGLPLEHRDYATEHSGLGVLSALGRLKSKPAFAFRVSSSCSPALAHVGHGV